MPPKKIPMRMCVGCREMHPKKELIRVVCSSAGEIKVDKVGKAPGRGAYICPQQSCLERAVKSRALERAFEHKIDEAVFEQLKEEISQGE
ncbi:MAG: YlxR family protein [Clostridia bacterium]|nr:YlxR family protein [Clostridia bacterium]